MLAAAVAFRLFMFLVPYAFVMVTGFGLASTAAGQDPGDAARSAGISGLFATAVSSTSTPSLANRLVALVVGGFALALTARSLVGVLWIVHRLIWRVQPLRKPTPWAPLILVGFVTVLFGLADLFAWVSSQSLGLRLVAFLLTTIVSGAAWFLASWLFPRDQCALWALVPGALIVGVGVGVLQILTTTYVVHVVTRKSALYGAIGIALGAPALDLFRGPVDHRRHLGERVTVEAPDQRGSATRRSVGASLIRSAPPGGRTPTRQPPTPSRPAGGSRGPYRRSRRSGRRE